MDKIKVDKNALLEVLQENLEQHKTDYAEAVIAYRKAAVEEITKMLAAAKTKSGKIVRSIDSPAPTSYEDSYETAILMLEMSVDDEIVLTAQEFSQYVEDKWDWRHSFANNTLRYKA